MDDLDDSRAVHRSRSARARAPVHFAGNVNANSCTS